MDIFEFDVEDSSSSNEFVRGKLTEADIEEWSTADNLPEVNRCFELIRRGFSKQKLYVLENIPKLFLEPDAQYKLIPFIVSEFENW